MLDAEYKELWNVLWNNSTNGRVTWRYINKVDFNKIYSDFYLNQVITGHGEFPQFQHDIFKKI